MIHRALYRFAVAVIISATVLLAGCQTGRGSSRVTVEAEYLRRQDPDFLAEQRSADNRDAAYLAFRHNMATGTERSLREALYYGNFFLVNFPDQRETASVANRLGWSSLFLLRELSIQDRSFFSDYGTNLEMFCRAIYYADLAEAYGQSDHFREQAVDVRNLVEYGFEEQSALFQYLQTQRSRRIVILQTDDDLLPIYRDIEKRLLDLKARYPRWLPEIVDRDLNAIQEQIQRSSEGEDR
jgi:hypothetical protein